MEISLVSCSQAKIGKNDESGFFNLMNNQVFSNKIDRICFDGLMMNNNKRWRRSSKLYVGLPLDGVSDCNSVNHARAIAAGLKALNLVGLEGVELPIWVCLSLVVDELLVLNVKTGMQVYQDFLESFKSSFSPFMGSTITDISVGLEPNGELRYPSNPPASTQVLGVGEFQCFDKHMLGHLKLHENGGSWQTPYGDFFLSWYSNQLISHGDRLLSLASSVFRNNLVTVSRKVPLVHNWYKFQSHPSEMTAGFYNSDSRDGYNQIADFFAKNSCKIILPGMDLSDEHQPSVSYSSPELLISRIQTACQNHNVQCIGENLSIVVKIVRFTVQIARYEPTI
ncbi:hypothetical protein MKW94_002776 [Papaver nudicaule]|uniref:Beta-amylase n=1 Tax=Papaver nudicaule TaxID=74823 RepID=A0AA41VGD0_PAPNU|nr:hypothetical protein [Papaver nudicaule]